MISNLKYADDTTLISKAKDEPKRHGRLSLRGAQDSSSRTSKCLPILSHYRQPDLQEVNLIDYLKKVKQRWWDLA